MRNDLHRNCMVKSGRVGTGSGQARPRRSLSWAIAVVLLAEAVAAAKSGPSGPAPAPQKPSGGTTVCPSLVPNPTARPARGTLSAKIDGVLWTATCVTVNTAPIGIVGLGGSDNLPTPTGFGFGFGPSNKVGTYPVSNPALGINALLTVGPAAWQSAGVSGGTGTLTFTVSTPSNVAGTFTFTLKPTTIVPIAGNTATGTRTVTDGVFNITF